MTFESILNDLGGFGRFQIMSVLVLSYNAMGTAWSNLQMSFASYHPDWECNTGYYGNDTRPNETVGECHVNNTSTNYQRRTCEDFTFHESANTVVTEWNLLCDRKYIVSVLESCQMGGIMLGALVSGQLADVVGRKKTLLGYVIFHNAMNIVTAFSVSWEMFAVCRFLVGIGIGGIVVVVFTHRMEFLPMKWRPLVGIIPAIDMGVGLFALSAYLLQDWSHLHIACGIFGIPGMVGCFFIPESVRWLTVQGRLKEAEKVCQKIASVNGKEMPLKTMIALEKIYRDEMEGQHSSKYSYIDVFKGWNTARITLTFCYFWCSYNVIFYGISFGISAMAGNLYMKIFLLGVVSLPATLGTFYFVNRLGRKWTTFPLILLAFLASSACLGVHHLVSEESQGLTMTALSLVIKMGTAAGMVVIQTWCGELYPTVTRNLGFGFANTAAKIGGIIAPFIIDFEDQATLSYIVVSALTAIMLVLVVVTPETKGQDLPDSLVVKHEATNRNTESVEANRHSANESVYTIHVNGHKEVTDNIGTNGYLVKDMTDDVRANGNIDNELAENLRAKRQSDKELVVDNLGVNEHPDKEIAHTVLDKGHLQKE